MRTVTGSRRGNLARPLRHPPADNERNPRERFPHRVRQRGRRRADEPKAEIRDWSAVTGQHGEDCRDRVQPGDAAFGQQLPESRPVEGRVDHERRAGQKRREETDDRRVDVEQRQRVETAIPCGQPVVAGDLPGDEEQLPFG
jgi:hypothetical protein